MAKKKLGEVVSPEQKLKTTTPPLVNEEGSQKENESPALPEGKVGLRKFDKFKTGGSQND